MDVALEILPAGGFSIGRSDQVRLIEGFAVPGRCRHELELGLVLHVRITADPGALQLGRDEERGDLLICPPVYQLHRAGQPQFKIALEVREKLEIVGKKYGRQPEPERLADGSGVNGPHDRPEGDRRRTPEQGSSRQPTAP